VEKSKVRLKISLEHARQAHLTISSKLLGPAEIVASPWGPKQLGPRWWDSANSQVAFQAW
jgi:hypothetical protein